MIKSITSIGKYATATSSGGNTYINGYTGAQGLGNMRYNTTNQNIEVFDGNNWIVLQMGYATVGLTAEAELLLDWASKKRIEEIELEHLSQTNETIKDLVNQIKEKQNQIKMVQTLIKSSDNEPQELMGS